MNLDAAAIGRTLDDVAEIGNRFAGTPGEAAARDYLHGRFRDLGLQDVALEPFRYLAYEPVEASCSAGECNPLEYTADGEAEGRAVYIGDATDADFARLDRAGVALAGKVVVTHSMFPFDLEPQLTERDIAALVHVCETPGGIVGTFAGAFYPPSWERPTRYPGVTIGHATGRELLSDMSCGPVTLRVSHRGRYEEREAANVCGAIPGDEGEIVLCAHYDSQADGPCVYDNGTGLAGVLETARALLESRSRLRIVVLASACEEIGLWGSTSYVETHDLSATKAMINFDGLASAYPADREIWCADAGLLALAAETARAHGWDPDHLHHARSTFGDHAPFADAGVPACLLWRPDYPYYHSRGDVRERVDAAAVADTASASGALAYRLAQE